MSSFSWLDFLELAQALQSNGTEASWRSAANRAYYAAFHPAKNYVKSKYGLNGKGSEHEKTWNALVRSGEPKEQLVGNLGDDLKRLRQSADYYRDPSFTGTKALQAIASAKKLLSKLDEIKNSP